MNLQFSLRTIVQSGSLGAVLLGVCASALGQEVNEFAPVDAAIPADSGAETAGFLFFPRGAIEEVPSTELMQTSGSFDASDHSEDAAKSMLDPGPDLDESDLDYGDRVGRSATTPIQYSPDETGSEAEGAWRESSVQRPEAVSLDDQPWIEWHKITVQGQMLPTAEEGLGVTSLDVRGTLKFSKAPFLFVTPRAAWHFLDGPPTTDLPPRLFDFSLDTTVYLPLNDRWTVQAGVAPGIYTDLHAMKDSFRLSGRGMVFYRWSPQFQFAGGIIYLGRKDIVALPAIGAVYTPSDDLKVELLFPKPKAAYRYHHDIDRERWVYVTGELGGGTWAIQRSSGADDIATYRDFQLLLGIEHKEPGVINWQMEGGYVFSREIQYDSEIGNTELPATAVLRLVLSY